MPSPVGPYLPNNGLVAMTWLRQRVPGVLASQVAGDLPTDVTKWADEGFIQVTEIPGAQADIDLPQARRPVVQVDYWACTPSSAKPPWHLAARLVELVRFAVEEQAYGQPLVMPDNYLGARVQAVYGRDEASRVLNDPSGYARYTQDLSVDWVRA